MSISHKWDILPIASIESARQDQRGLLVTAAFHGTPEAQACRQVMMERLQRGKSVKASIGYTVADDARVTEGGKSYRLLKSIDLYEFSWVAMPANPNADFMDVKGRWPGASAGRLSEFDREARLL